MKQKTSVALLILGALAIAGLLWASQSGALGAGTLSRMSERGGWFLPLVAVAALLDSINPCAFSVLILTIVFLFQLGKTRKGVLRIGFIYIFGIFITYILIGLGILETLQFFGIPNFVGKIAAILLIALGGINVLGDIFPGFPIKLKIPESAHGTMSSFIERGSTPAAFVLGIFVALTEFPCTGGPYLLILGLLHDQRTYFQGFGYLLFYNLLFVLPLVIILGIASNPLLVERVRSWQKEERKSMRLLGGVAMVVLGILIFVL